MRLIDADELLDLYSGKRLDDTFVPVPVIRQNIKDMPTVQAKKGKWILVEVKTPHGRLIDADELKELYTGKVINDNMVVPIAVIKQNIDDMTTIIDAEEETNE